MDWTRILAYITGTVNQELLLRNEYLAAENRILNAQLKTPLRLTFDCRWRWAGRVPAATSGLLDPAQTGSTHP